MRSGLRRRADALSRYQVRLFLLFLLLSAASSPLSGQTSLSPVYNPSNGHWYQAVWLAGAPNWYEARAAAQSLTYNGTPGHLATVSSPEENAFITGAVLPLQRPLNNWWLGGYQDRSAPDYREPGGAWRWVTGEPWLFSGWSGGEPNNVNGGENALEIRGDGTWNDVPEFSGINAFVVEYEPPIPPGQIFMQLFPPSVVGGATVTAQVTLPAPAPPLGAVLVLGSSHPTVAAVPASFTAVVPPGATTVAFPVVTFPVALATTVTLSVAWQGTGAGALATLQVLPGAPVTPPGNLLLNGSFEEPGSSPYGTRALPGWQVTQGTVDLVPAGEWQPAPGEGRQSLDLVGSPGAARIEQTFATMPGQEYLFSGWMAHNPSNPVAPEGRADVFLNGQFFTLLFHRDPAATTREMRWVPFAYRFRATASATTLALAEVSNLWSLGGLVLDGLAVAPVGEPFPPLSPGTPTFVSVRPVAPTQIELAWLDTSADETAFEIQRRTLAGDWVWIALVTANTTRFTDYAVLPGTTYLYRVRAQSARGASAWSPEASGTTLP
jgi:hypothetical protein